VILFVWLPVQKAAIWSLLGGWLLLPSALKIDVHVLPPLDKFTIPTMTTFLLCWMKGSQSPAPPRSILIYLLAFCLFLSPILSTLNNSYEIQIGDRSLPGYYPIDGIKLAFRNLVMVAPFFIGMRFLSSEKARALLLRSIPIAALFYSIPMLFEIRMSPQLHKWVYGYYPSDFSQQYRAGGFRPVVFLDHGLQVALFTSIAVIAALVMVRGKWPVFRIRPGWAAGYLAGLLLLCKTLSAAVYLVFLAPVVLLTRPRTWLKIAFAVLLFVCAYPALRTYNAIPLHHIVEAANSISADRSSSFKTRILNEDILLAKANQKPLLGWGSWGRNRVYQEGTGEDISVTDGGWIIQFGSWGWLGYLAYFGLFAAAVFRSRIAVRGPVTQDSIVVGGLSLIMAVNLLDMIPNSAVFPFTYLAAGAVAGAVRARSAKKAPWPALAKARSAVAAE
jgi:hypothetical protein